MFRIVNRLDEPRGLEVNVGTIEEVRIITILRAATQKVDTFRWHIIEHAGYSRDFYRAREVGMHGYIETLNYCRSMERLIPSRSKKL
jgi:hypothetical protein